MRGRGTGARRTGGASWGGRCVLGLFQVVSLVVGMLLWYVLWKAGEGGGKGIKWGSVGGNIPNNTCSESSTISDCVHLTNCPTEGYTAATSPSVETSVLRVR